MSMLLALLNNELRVDRQLVACETHGLPGDRLRDARHLEHHPARLDHRDPVVGGPLAGSHPDLRRLLCDRLVREDPDPDASTALDVVRHGAPCRLDLAAGQPADLLGHQAEVTEADRGPALGQAGASAALHLAMLDTLWHQHLRTPPPPARRRPWRREHRPRNRPWPSYRHRPWPWSCRRPWRAS